MITSLAPPKPVTTLKQIVIPQLQMRAGLLNDMLQNFGMPAEYAQPAVQGYVDGHINGVTVKGIGSNGYVQDHATLDLGTPTSDHEISLDLANGRSLTEAVSRKLAHGLSYSIATMQRKGLSLVYTYHLTPHVLSNPALRQSVYARLGLSDSPSHGYQPGYAPREVFAITPGLDSGVRYSHHTAWRIT